MADPACICAALRKATRRLSALYDDALAPVGINIAQFSLLRTIDRMGRISQTELGRAMELDRSTIGRNFRVLQRMGLVRAADSDDQREAAIELDARGREALAAALPLWAGVQVRVQGTLGTDRTLALLDDLGGIGAG